jgi:hypothetical protein
VTVRCRRSTILVIGKSKVSAGASLSAVDEDEMQASSMWLPAAGQSATSPICRFIHTFHLLT